MSKPRIQITDVNGCTYKDSVSVIVDDDREVFIPNTFTPNGDECIDIFFIRGQSASDIEHLAIYNRWGTRIFEVNGNIPWNGENCPDGVYVVTVLIDNRMFTKSLALVR